MKKYNRRKVVRKEMRDERIWARIPWYARALVWWAVGTFVGLFLFHAIDAQAAWRCSQLVDQAAEYDGFFLSESERQMCESVATEVKPRFTDRILEEIADARLAFYGTTSEPVVTNEEPDWYKHQQYARHKDMAYLNLRDALKVICSCESTGRPDGVPRHYESDGESVLTGRITPADRGMCQISLDYHAESAARMGLDVHDPHDNVAYANWLYDQYGTQPWNASRKCWEGHI